MDYNCSDLPKVIEIYRLLKKCLLDTDGQARRAFSDFKKMEQEFDLHGKSILELGAGSRGGLIKLFSSSNEVVGIDKYLGKFNEGWYKTTKTFFRKLIFDPVFEHHLKKLSSGKLYTRKLLKMDAIDLKFPPASFDFIFSRYLLEHILSIDKLVSEIHRCLRGGGVSYHKIALFTTLDGAHTLNWKKYSTWQHLISDVPSVAYINRYRLSDYKDAFTKVFGFRNVKLKILINEKAKKLLTPEKCIQLSDYSSEELLAKSVEVVAIKRL